MLDATKVAGDPAEPGTVVTVEWGSEHYSPFPYHGFDTGTLRVSAPVRPGETVAQATVRVYREAAAVMAQVRSEKINEYLRTAAALKAHVNATQAGAR